jgi:hypothetical protein
VPVIIIILIWWIGDNAGYGEPGLIKFLFYYYKNEFFQSIPLRGGLLIFDNYALFDRISGYAVAFFFSFFTLTIVFWPFIVSKKPSIVDFIKENKYRQIFLFILGSLACFLFIPLRLPGYSFILQRFSIFFFIAIIILGSLINKSSLRPFAIGIICAVCLVHYVLWYGYFREFNKENETFTKNIFSFDSNDKKMAGLIYDYKFRGRPVYEHFLDYYIVWKNGIATTRFIDERSFPVGRKADMKALPKYLHNVGKNNNYDGRYEGMDYILVRGQIPLKDKKYFNNFQTIKSSGKWSVMKNENHLIIPSKIRGHDAGSG